VEDHEASVNIFADKRETPLFSACEQGHLQVVEYLLNNTDADPTLKTARGFNCLDIAIKNHQVEIVQLLLDHPQWRKLMESTQYDKHGAPITPMRRLIISMPDIAYDVIDKKLTTTTGGDDQAVHLVTYDYTYFDDQYNIPDWVHGKYTSVLTQLI
jgi:ankyrin repeat protein